MSMTVTDPTTGKVLRDVPGATPEQVEAILNNAVAAGRAWRDVSFTDRAKLMTRVARIMREDADALGFWMTEEMGKPVKEARAEVLKSALCAEHYAEHAEAYLAACEVASDATRSYVHYLPLGVVLGILPWNAPFWLAFRYCAPTLMAGNACVMKHDKHVPKCAEAIASVFERADAPPGLFANLHIETARIEAVIRDWRIAAVSFTGSDRAGSIVASVAASEIKPAVLELGGSDPCIVLADADLDAAADIITLSRIINAGQSCIAAKRILVEAPVYDAVVSRLHDRLAKLKVGDPRDESTDVGPIARADLRDGLHRQVRASIEGGARCILGGEIPDGPGFFYPVTMLVDAPRNVPAMCEETFGPVMVVSKINDVEDGIALANDSIYGLGASVWTEAARGEALARRIEAGQVSVNGIVKTDPRLPSGGIKRSGYGRELGREGIHEFVNRQQVWIGPKQG